MNFLIAMFFAMSHAVHAQNKIQLNIEKYQLKNGLTVILHPDDSSPFSSYHQWFRAGSKDEEEGYTGIAHLFEHMMFKGAKRYSNKKLDQTLAEVGAEYNAFTSRDYTAYYINLLADKLELAIDIESDRLENLAFNDSLLKSEREVVKEERRFRVDNSHSGVLFENVFASTFSNHPYRWPVIGWMEDLNRITIEKCQEFFKRFYSPNNAVVVVGGKFDVPKVKSLIEKYYGHMKPSEIKRPLKEFDQPSRQFKSKWIQRTSQNEMVAHTWITPKAGARESYALDIAASVLGDGTSSRLHKKIVEDLRLADSVGVSNYTLQDHGVMMINVSHKALGAQATAEKAAEIRERVSQTIKGELFKLRTTFISSRELQKAKNQILNSFIENLKGLAGRTRILAQSEVMFGDPLQLIKDLDIYDSITAEEVRAAVKKYINMDNRTQIVLSPFEEVKK